MDGSPGPAGATGATGPNGALSSCWQVDPVAVASGADYFIGPVFSYSSVQIVAVKYWLQSGTNAVVHLRSCGTSTPDDATCTSDVTGFSTGNPATVTTTPTTQTVTPFTLVAGAGFKLWVESVSGTPRNLTYCVFMQ
jgi:hypothetical protein